MGHKPISNWWWIGGTAVVGFGVYAYVIRYINEQLQVKINGAIANSGIDLQSSYVSDIYVFPKSRNIIDLSLSNPAKRSFNLHLGPNGRIVLPPIDSYDVPDPSVIDVQQTSFGATITAVGKGSTMIYIYYPPDTIDGVQDSIIAVSVDSGITT